MRVERACERLAHYSRWPQRKRQAQRQARHFYYRNHEDNALYCLINRRFDQGDQVECAAPTM